MFRKLRRKIMWVSTLVLTLVIGLVTLAGRLWRWFALFALILMALVWLLQTVLLQGNYRAMVKRKVKKAASEIEAALSRDDYVDALDALASENALLIVVTDAQGNLLYSTDEHSSLYSADSQDDNSENPYSHTDGEANDNPYRKTEGHLSWQIGKQHYYDIELKLAKLGAAMGNGELAKWVGEIYQGGNVEGVDEAEAVEIAIEWWQKAAELGVPNGLTDIGLLYAHSGVPGGGKLFGNIEEDPAKAMEYYLAGFEAGDSKAARYIAMAYDSGNGVEQNYEEAAKYFSIATELNDTTAFWYLGDYYFNGTGVEQDYAKAAELYAVCAGAAKATPPGVKQSRYQLGVMYEQGLGVEQNLDTAIEYYKGSAEAEYEPALEALARLGVEVKAE